MGPQASGSRKKTRPTGELEEALRRRGYRRVAGVDEAGRGPLAGPVVAAACILGDDWQGRGLDDSKRLSAPRREELAQALAEQAEAWAVGLVEPAEIDRINIHQASLLAMRRAVGQIKPAADFLLVDGRFTLELAVQQEAVVGGDGRCLCVAAASIIAKVHRDRLMVQAHQRYPAYNFAANKGYPTAEHRAALRRHGPCPLHRRSYGPVAQRCLELGLD